MSILDRLNMLIRSEVTSFRGRGSGKKNIERTLGEARQDLARIMATERRLNREYQDALDEVQRFEDLAVERLRRGDEPGAAELLKDKHRADAHARRLREELDEQRSRFRDLQSALDALEYRIEAARDRAGSLSEPTPEGGLRTPPPTRDEAPSGSYYGRYRSGEYRPTRPPAPRKDPDPPRPTTASSGSDPFARFDEMEDRIRRIESEVGAEDELFGFEDPLRDDLADKFRDLETSTRSRRQLDALRRAGVGGSRDSDSDRDSGSGDALDRLRRRFGGDDD